MLHRHYPRDEGQRLTTNGELRSRSSQPGAGGRSGLSAAIPGDLLLSMTAVVVAAEGFSHLIAAKPKYGSDSPLAGRGQGKACQGTSRTAGITQLLPPGHVEGGNIIERVSTSRRGGPACQRG
jgi:hypothetical protein